MRDGCGILAQRDFYLVLCNDRTGQRRSQQILMLVNRAGLERREYVPGQEFLAQILDDHFASARLVGLFDHCINIVTLANVTHHGDHFA